jgi:hypothetical protein
MSRYRHEMYIEVFISHPLALIVDVGAFVGNKLKPASSP